MVEHDEVVSELDEATELDEVVEHDEVVSELDEDEVDEVVEHDEVVSELDGALLYHIWFPNNTPNIAFVLKPLVAYPVPISN